MAASASPKQHQVYASTGRAVASCLAYSFFSISMVLANKLVLSGYEVTQTFSLLLWQTVCTLALILAARHWNIVHFDAFQPSRAWLWLPVNLCFLAMLFTGFKSLKLLAVPMVNIFKNLTNILILAGDWYLFGNPVTRGIVGALLLTVLGATLAGAADIAFSWEGYLWMAANCCATAGYVLSMRSAMKRGGMSEFDCGFYNNLLGIPLVLGCAVLMGEMPAVFYIPQMSQVSFVSAVTFTGVVGFALQMSALWCVKTTSSATFGMVGSMNKIPLSVLGVFLFKEEMTLKLAGFITLGLAGGILFTLAKLAQKQEAERLRLGGAAGSTAPGGVLSELDKLKRAVAGDNAPVLPLRSEPQDPVTHNNAGQLASSAEGRRRSSGGSASDMNGHRA